MTAEGKAGLPRASKDASRRSGLNNRKLGSQADVQTKLEEQLERIQGKLGLGLVLKVVWMPNADSDLSGEVKNNLIYVYEADEEKAVDTLRHEFLDFCITQAIEPYREVTNRLIKMINDNAYKRKEKVVEALTRLLE